MPDQLTERGLEIKDLQTRNREVIADVQANISPVETCPPTEGIGQLVRIPNEKNQQTAELIQAVYGAFDPDNVTGIVQDALCAITGTRRQLATHGVVTLTVNLDGGTVLDAGSIAGVGSSETNRWATNVDVVAPVGPVADYEVPATCITAGTIAAPSRTIRNIVTPVSGWNSVTNSEATKGREREKAPELRDRRERELALGGSTTLNAVVAEVSNIEGVLQATGYQNTSWHANDGMPPTSIEIVYWNGNSAPVDDELVTEIAETIFRTKAGAVRAYGTDTNGDFPLLSYQIVTDDQGNDHRIGFTRATMRNVSLEFTLTTDSSFPGEDDFKAAITDWGQKNLKIGSDVLYGKMFDIAYNVPGVIDVSVRLCFTGNPWGASNLTVGGREIAAFDTANITIV